MKTSPFGLSFRDSLVPSTLLIASRSAAANSRSLVGPYRPFGDTESVGLVKVDSRAVSAMIISDAGPDSKVSQAEYPCCPLTRPLYLLTQQPRASGGIMTLDASPPRVILTCIKPGIYGGTAMTIEERIERLERTNRRYRLMFTLLGVVAICAVGISATQDDGIPDVIQAKAFEVVDDEGKRLAKLYDNQGNGILETFNDKGRQIVMLGVSVNRAGFVSIFNDKGKQLVRLGTREGYGGIITYNGKGNTIVELGSVLDGKSTITVSDDKGKRMIMLASDENGGAIGVFGKTDELRCAISVLKNDDGTVFVTDHNGKLHTIFH